MVPRDHNDQVGDEAFTVCHVSIRTLMIHRVSMVGDTGVWLTLVRETFQATEGGHVGSEALERM